MPQSPRKLLICQMPQRLSRHTLFKPFHNAELLSDGEGRIHMISRNHDRRDTRLLKIRHRLRCLWSRRIAHPDHPQKDQLTLHGL